MVLPLIIMSYAQISQAAVSQQKGFFDTQYINITNLDCINCHGPDTSDRHHATYKAVNSDCSYCHQVVGGQMQVNRDCRSCHYATPHHNSSYALNGDCAACHSPDVVSAKVYDPGVYNAPSPVNPAQCRKCHTGDPLSIAPIGESRDLHQETGFNCQTCHNADLTMSIRLCEQCHKPKDLHTLHQNDCGGCHAPGNPAQLPLAVLKPAINSLNVTSGLSGDTLVIDGANFGIATGSVKVGIISANVISWQDQSVTIIVPVVAPDNYDIAVINSNGTSNVKAYTVSQGPDTIVTSVYGMPDRPYATLIETDCRSCHGLTSDRHHALYNAMQCSQCHQVVNNTVDNAVYDVVYDQVTVTRDCKVCHADNAHHNAGPAKAGICTACHSNRIISDYNSEPKPATFPGDTTPGLSSCNTCHQSPTNQQLHHDTALDCTWCHQSGEAYPIRTCENCHSAGTVHNVESHLKPQNCVGCHAARPEQFPVLPAGKPEIQFIAPNSGGPGANFTITGLDFGDAFDKGKVYFDVYNAAVLYWDNSTVTVRVPDLPLGNYSVFIENPAGRSNRYDFTVTAPGVLAGKVTDKSGAALAGAKVDIGVRRVTTDANGIYSVSGLAQGTYTVQVSADGYTSANQNIDILNSLETKLDFFLQKGGARSHLVSSTGYDAGSSPGCAGCHATDAVTKEAELVEVHQNAAIPNYSCSTCHNPVFEGAGKVITGDGILDMKINGVTVIYCAACHDSDGIHNRSTESPPYSSGSGDDSRGNYQITPVAGIEIFPFEDVPETHWGVNEIVYMYRNDIVRGFADGTFRPNNKVTRAELASVTAKALGIGTISSGRERAFLDLPLEHWAYSQIEAVVQAGIMAGYNDGRFCPDAPVTREELVQVIIKALNYQRSPVENYSLEVLKRFKDRDKIPGWAEKAIAEAVDSGIVQGIREDLFGSGEKSKRDQVVVLVYKMLKLRESTLQK